MQLLPGEFFFLVSLSTTSSATLDFFGVKDPTNSNAPGRVDNFGELEDFLNYLNTHAVHLWFKYGYIVMYRVVAHHGLLCVHAAS